MTRLTPPTFDALLSPAPGKRIIWTAAAIGQRIGRGEDFVRDVLAQMPGSPVRRMGRRFYAIEDELVQYMGANP